MAKTTAKKARKVTGRITKRDRDLFRRFADRLGGLYDQISAEAQPLVCNVAKSVFRNIQTKAYTRASEVQAEVETALRNKVSAVDWVNITAFMQALMDSIQKMIDGKS